MSYHTKLSSILHRQKVLEEMNARAVIPSRSSTKNSTESKTPSDNSATAARSSSRTPNRNSKRKGCQICTKTVEGTVFSRRVNQLTKIDSATSSSAFNRSESFTSSNVSNVPSFMTALSDERKEDEKVIEEELLESRCLDVNGNFDNADMDNKQRHPSKSRVVFHEQTSDDIDTKDKGDRKQKEKLKGFEVAAHSGVGISAKATASTITTGESNRDASEDGTSISERIETAISISSASLPSFHCHHQLNRDDAAVRSRGFPGFQEDADIQEDADKKVIEEELLESRCLDVNGNFDNADTDNKQRHPSRYLVVFQEQTPDDTDTKDKGDRKQKEKLKGFVVAVHSGVGISAKATASTITTGEINRDAFEDGTPISARLETALSISSASLPSFHCHHQLHRDDAAVRSRGFPGFQGENLQCPQTCKPMGADSGFPSDTTLYNFLGDLGDLVDMRWSSPFASRTCTAERKLHSGSGNTVDTCNNSQVYSDVWIPAEYGEETGIIASAYDMLTAGLRYASKLIGDETELEPQEDFVRYSGYKIKVQGKELLLESVHVNRDFQINSKSGTYSRSIHSFISLQPHTLSREVLEHRSRTGESGKEKRIRIVIRMMGASAFQVEQAGPIAPAGFEHFVQIADGKWTFFLKENHSIHERSFEEDKKTNGKEKNYQKNFVEIGCPIGVYPGMIRYGLVNGLLYIDAP